jgi:cellulose synthase operon protein C
MANRARQGAAVQLPANPLATRAAEAMQAGDFKQAIELFKRLDKQDSRQEWRDGLAEAFAARAGELVAKGMFDEAEVALAKAAAANGQMHAPLLHVQCLIGRGQPQKASELAVKHVGTDKLPPADAARFAELAAALWLAAPVPLAVADPGTERGRFGEQAAAARESLTAWIDGAPPQAIEAQLGRIPLRSPFGAVRIILKSLITAPGDPDRARQLLQGIAADSPFASLRDAVEATLPGEAMEWLERWNRAGKAQQLFAVQVKGLPDTAALTRLVKAERSGPAALISALVDQAANLPADDVRRACLNLLPRAPDRLRQIESALGPLTDVERHRALALGAESRKEWQRAERSWVETARAIASMPGPDAGLAAGVIYRHLARLAACHPEMDGNGDTDAPEIDHLELSLEVDPGHRDATLELIRLYRACDRDKDWHRLAEAAVQRFPDDSAVLLQAVESAIARDAYKKAAGFARKLLVLDPINPAVRAQMIELQISHAHKLVRTKRPDLAAKELASAAEWERPGATSFRLSIKRALVKLELGAAPEAEGELRAGIEQAGGGVAGWFHASLQGALLSVGTASATLLRRGLSAAAQEAGPSKAELLALAEAAGSDEARGDAKTVRELIFRLRALLVHGASLILTPAEFHPVADMFWRAGTYDLLGDYARSASRRDPADLVWEFYRIVARTKGNPDVMSVSEQNRILTMEELLGEGRDSRFADQIRRFLDGDSVEGRRRARRRPPPAIDFDILEDEEDEDDLDDIAALLGMNIDDVPDVVMDMVAKRGRKGAVVALIEQMRKSPLAAAVSKGALREFAHKIVTAVMMLPGAGAR